MVSHNEETGPPSEGKPVSNNLNVTSIDAARSKSSNGSKQKKPFVTVPTAVARNAKLSPQARALYMIIRSYAWQDPGTFVGQETLMADMGYKRRQTINKLAAELKAAVLIRIHHNWDGGTDGRQNYYELLEVEGDTCATAHIDRYAETHPTKKHSTKTQKPGGAAPKEPIPNTVPFTPSPSLATTSFSSDGNNEETEIGALERTYIAALQGQNGDHAEVVTPTRLVAPEGQVENGGSGNGTCRVKIPGRARYVKLLQRAEADPHSLDWRELHDLRRVMLDATTGPCILHRGGLGPGPCSECAEMESRLFAAQKVSDSRPWVEA